MLDRPACPNAAREYPVLAARPLTARAPTAASAVPAPACAGAVVVAATGTGLVLVDTGGVGDGELGAAVDVDVVDEEGTGVLEDGGSLEGPLAVVADLSAKAPPAVNSTIDTPTAIPAAARLRSNAQQTRPRTKRDNSDDQDKERRQDQQSTDTGADRPEGSNQ